MHGGFATCICTVLKSKFPESSTALVLFDRCLMDGKAFMEEEAWRLMLEKFGFTEVTTLH